MFIFKNSQIWLYSFTALLIDDILNTVNIWCEVLMHFEVCTFQLLRIKPNKSYLGYKLFIYCLFQKKPFYNTGWFYEFRTSWYQIEKMLYKKGEFIQQMYEKFFLFLQAFKRLICIHWELSKRRTSSRTLKFLKNI